MKGDLVNIEGLKLPVDDGPFTFDEEDFLLYGMLTDPVYMPEVTWKDPENWEYHGQYRVRDYQYIIFRLDDAYAIVACARSVGKALGSHEPVLTPAGWRAIGDLAVGDYVVGSAGYPTPVIEVHPQGLRDLFDVEFTDETVIRCDAEHLWSVTCDSWNTRSQGPQLRTTAQLQDSKMRYKVPLAAPVHLQPQCPLRLPPWLVGCLIGDGSFTTRSMIGFSASESEVVDRVQRELTESDSGELVHDRGIDYYIRRRGQRAGGRSRAPEVLAAFRDWGIHPGTSSDHFIPEEYLWASVEDRLELLRGLVDADGTVLKSGGIEISVASPVLASHIRTLVLSLGGRARARRGKAGYRKDGVYVQCKDRYRVVCVLPRDVIPCWLPRKVALYLERNATRTKNTQWRGIRAIRPAGRGSATCIKVAAEDGLFVARDFILTHNTESEKSRAVIHLLTRYDNMLITAPELIHLLPLTDAIEDRVRDSTLIVELLDMRGGQTGFTHRPFGIDCHDGTKIIGRIPRLTGVGVRGMHQARLIVEEGQDYPARGWVELNETVKYDSVDRRGEPDFRYWIYGVHGGNKASGFDERARSPLYRKVKVTALRRPDWNQERKANAMAAYGGTSSPDYKRNILGEPGAGATAYFVVARVMACVDQHVTRGETRGSDYNEQGYVHQMFRAEELDGLQMQIGDLLDLPDIPNSGWWGGMDIGLTDSPTVISLFAETAVNKQGAFVARGTKGSVNHIALVRRYTLERFRTKQIRETMYAIGWHLGGALLGFGQDMTGLGFPIFQEMEDDELCPPHLRDVSAGYMFNSKVEVAVDKELITENQGVKRDHLGNMVKEIVDEVTGEITYVTLMPFIAASTRYIREEVDSGFLLLPFDTAVTEDMLQETKQRVDRMGAREGSGGPMKKGDRFHILDSFRAAFFRRRQDEILEKLKPREQEDVLDLA